MEDTKKGYNIFNALDNARYVRHDVNRNFLLVWFGGSTISVYRFHRVLQNVILLHAQWDFMSANTEDLKPTVEMAIDSINKQVERGAYENYLV